MGCEQVFITEKYFLPRHQKIPSVTPTTKTSRKQDEQINMTTSSPPNAGPNPGNSKFDRVGTVHYYDYIQTHSSSNRKPQERPPPPLPPIHTTDNITTNISYESFPPCQDPNDRYYTPSTLPRPSIIPKSPTGETGMEQYEEGTGEEYISMVPNPSHGTNNSSQMVMYI